MLALFASMAFAASAGAPLCQAGQIAVSLDGKAGDFNGMSHSGTLLVLRNRGAMCRIEALPRMTFQDGRGRALPIVRTVPVGMHPGPVMLPVTLPAHGAVSTPLRWVSGEVYDHSRCFTTARVKVAIGGGRLATALSAHICGPTGKAAGFDQPPLRLGRDSAAPGL